MFFILSLAVVTHPASTLPAVEEWEDKQEVALKVLSHENF
jgi:hypothetical protein